ncbi:MAG: aldehyde dehydrogenase [Planctomycetota bacterium]|nr:aldehyde dehydrogenase [Planctomycetota bacterium]
MVDVRNFIGGQFVASAGGRTLDNIEPATASHLGTIPDSDESDVRSAVDAAARAFPAWSATPVADRARILARVADLIDRDLEALARDESIDTGKPISLARVMDIPRAAANFRFFAGAALHWRSESHRTELPAAPGAPRAIALNHTLRQPLGVVALISPWNLPIYLLSWKIAPAIASGNTCVCKPSELTPVTAHRLAGLLAEAGLPPGVVNIVHGTGRRAGAPLVVHDRVKAISFTGGTSTGRDIAAAAAPAFKKLSLELGGKNPTIIFADAPLHSVIPQAVRAAFTNQGQVCLCGSRIYVERSIYDAFAPRFTAAVRALRLGDPLDDATQLGALVSAAHRAKVASYVEIARAEGGRLLTPDPAAPLDLPDRCRRGFFHPPVVIEGLDNACRTQQEEIFGPVVTLTPFDSESHAIELANQSRYGLAASVWTSDAARAQRLAERLEAGMVWINCWLVRDLRVPFGGVKDSGVGREGGEDALRFFTDSKNVCQRFEL